MVLLSAEQSAGQKDIFARDLYSPTLLKVPIISSPLCLKTLPSFICIFSFSTKRDSKPGVQLEQLPWHLLDPLLSSPPMVRTALTSSVSTSLISCYISRW
jgi:hypothetical protein